MDTSSLKIKIRVYKAINNLEACKRFAKGHADVLKSYNIKKVTSSSSDWFYDKGVYVIAVESEDGKEMYGGARFHIKNEECLLPIEQAIGKLDSNIYNLINRYPVGKTGELCGLWNARSISGLGISVLLTRAGVAKAGILLARRLDIQSLFILCAPWTVEMVRKTGFVIETSLGNQGTFAYPKPDLLATVMVVKDVDSLKYAHHKEREDIFNLRENPIQKKNEKGPKGVLEVEYNLLATSNS